MTKNAFTYKDYLLFKDYYGDDFDLKRIVQLGGINQKHDKTFKEILSKPEEMQKFLKDFLGLEVKKENLEKYKSSFITSTFENRESDIIYKIKDKEILFLVEHQSTVSKRMPNRILEYCVEIMREAIKNKTLEEGSNPIIVPIVIYTGERKWKVEKEFSETQIKEEEYQEYLLKQKYELIDINKYSKEELLEINTKLSNMMLIEKCKTSEEIRETMIKIIEQIKKLKKEDQKEMKKWYEQIIKYVLGEKLGKYQIEIIEMIEKGEKGKMEEWLERVKRNDEKIRKDLINKGRQEGIKEGKQEGIREGIREGKEEGRKQGRQITIIETAKNMLKEKLDIDLISRITGLLPSEIQKIKI